MGSNIGDVGSRTHLKMFLQGSLKFTKKIFFENSKQASFWCSPGGETVRKA